MKKMILAVTMISSLLLLNACGSTAGKVDHVQIEIGESSKFTTKEIEQAIDATKEQFKEFEHCELHSLSYDEEESDFRLKSLREDPDLENMIVLFSDFYVNSKAEGAWNPDSYYNWMFILSRENKNSDWIVEDWGY